MQPLAPTSTSLRPCDRPSFLPVPFAPGASVPLCFYDNHIKQHILRDTFQSTPPVDRCYSKEQTWQNKRSVTSNTGNISYTGLQIMLCGSLSRSCLDHCSLTDLNTHQASRFHHIYDNSRNMVTCIISIWRHH